MSDINDKNYTGSNVVVVGNAAGPATVKSFNNGGSQAELSVAVGKGYKDKDDKWVDTGTDWYTYIASEKYADDNWPDVGKGDKVRIDEGRLDLRPYVTKNGEAAVDAQVRFGTLVIVEKAKGKSGNSGSEGVAPF
jgi:single-stranded DNA-binding protein